MWQNADLILALIEEHLARRPATTLRDIYKLLYQGVRGPEHIITSPQAFTERLQAEWESAEPADDDPLLESIRPDGALLRLNLRPFKAAGGDLKALTTACLKTGQRAWGTPAELQQTWFFLCLPAARHSVLPCCQVILWLSRPGSRPMIFPPSIIPKNTACDTVQPTAWWRQISRYRNMQPEKDCRI